MSVVFGQEVTINDKAPYFKGQKALVAYIGKKGISVYLKDHVIDDCIPLNNGEYDV